MAQMNVPLFPVLRERIDARHACEYGGNAGALFVRP